MNIIDRVKNIIVSPKTEWQTIALEPQSMSTVITTYVIPLALIGAVATFIGYGFVGVSWFGVRISGIEWGWRMALNQLITSLVGVVATTFVVDALAPSFASEKNIDKSAQLVAYGYTPAFIGSIFNVFPAIAIIGALLSLYGIYVMYTGFGPMKKTPEDKKVTYFIVCILVLIALYFVIGLVMGNILGTRAWLKGY